MSEVKIKDVQEKILEIIVYFDDICRMNGIEYYLMGGSALGAIRHEGFIPWDDDLDVFMTYDNYKKFISVFREQLDTDRFYLQEEATEEWPLYFSKIRMNGTIFMESNNIGRNMHNGVFIDVFCLNNVANNKLISYIQYVAARVLTAITLSRRGYFTNNKKKLVAIKLARILDSKVMEKLLIKIVRSNNKKSTKYVGHFFGKAKFKNSYFPKIYLGKPRYVKFENLMLPVPNKVEEYLKDRFGDYMMIPSKEEQDNSVHAEFVKL
ncbi:phosphorylcholine transferase LicD [Clostridium perfringens]|uniref:LicD family protein n=1 Tax=Clostridium perfringens TaxID=1502 RepID=UPI0018A8D117|nr:LicD family protein [Clostridium perfringens]EJT5931355.1 LicD family protein [Clostridium perfringens]EJT6162617.1 LicD family protein [Clostridium perfringens]EJT6505103.1 LicD family protein [Clostridium perfringens]HEF0383876.1 LicD family protein [Clostridium perfringens]